MRLFGNRSSDIPERKPRRKPTQEELDRREERKEKRRAQEKFVELARENPELERQWVSKKMGIEINPPDPVADAKKELDSWRYKEAMKRAKEDKDYAQDLTTSVLDELGTGEDRRSGRETPWYGNGGGYSDPLEALDVADQIRERLGISGQHDSWADVFKDRDIVLGFLNFLSNIKGGGEPTHQPPQRMYVIRVNGEDRTVTEAQYKQMIQAGQLKPIAELAAPEEKPEQAETTEQVTEQPEEQAKEPPAGEPPLPEFLEGVDINAVLEWMDTEPQEFVTELKQNLDRGVEEARFIWGFLSNVTYDVISNFLMPYQGHSQIGVAVERILSEEGNAWLESVIELVQEKKL